MNSYILGETSANSFIGKAAILASVAEGVGESHFWEAVKNQKRSNGSLVNSPSTTAAGLLYHHDKQSYEYLCSVLKEYSSGGTCLCLNTFDEPLDVYFT